jgi:SpoIID/LytB domain protein
MRNALALAAILCSALAVSVGTSGGATSANVATATPATFLLTGGGWGHGVGMAQWGAFGQAKEGRTFDQILTYYYTGVELGFIPAGVPKTLRVLVGDAAATVAIGSSQPFRVRDAGSKTYQLPAGSITVGPELELPVGALGDLEKLPGPLLFLPAKDATLTFGGREYRSNLRVGVVKAKLQIVNAVPLEAYLQGVVPGEMPVSWPLEALKAQAVAARTYAIANLVKGRSYDLYADWRSQMYYGVTSETALTTKAVRDTRGRVLLYDHKPITALYSSSSGGRTASALDVYGADVPYLVPVDDPWDIVSPHHAWVPKTFTARALAKALGLSGSVVDARKVAGSEGRPASLVFTTSAGATSEIRLTDVRSRLALKSSGFRLGTIRLARPAGPRRDLAVALTGVARDVEAPVLQKLGSGGTWVKGPPLALAEDGTFAVTVRPPGALTVRLVADGLVGQPLTIPPVGSPS